MSPNRGGEPQPANTNATQPTDVSVEEFLATVTPAVRAQDAAVLVDLYRDVTGLEPVMWGPSIVGFGEKSYETTRSSERTPALAFSPRRANLTLYFSEGFDPYGRELSELGPHKASRSCLYITRLARIDMDVLKAMLTKSFRGEFHPARKPETVEEYVAAVPPATRGRFDELRAIAQATLPDATESLSYGIVGYRPTPKKRAYAFISGFSDHVAIYPAPKPEEMPERYRDALRDHQRSKGTVWFGLGEPLERGFVEAILTALFARA